MIKKQKLELTWTGKENRPKLEPRILFEDPAKSYHAKHRVTDKDNLTVKKIPKQVLSRCEWATTTTACGWRACRKSRRSRGNRFWIYDVLWENCVFPTHCVSEILLRK